MKQYEKLNIRDHFVFGKICSDIFNSQMILSALLEKEIILSESEIEHYMQEYKTNKYVRLDLLAEDNKGSVYNAELQHKSTNSSRQKELPYRSRYYQALIDTAIVNSGIDYEDIPETYIIFICTYDPFGLGLPKYTIEPSCAEYPLLDVKDRTHKIFFNTTADLSSLPCSTRNMLKYINDDTVSDDTTKYLNDVVQSAISKEIWRNDYMLTVVHDKDVYKDGYDSGYDSRQPEVDTLQDEINTLHSEVADKDAIIAELTAQLNSARKS